MPLTIYLHFNGDCRDAFEFYRSVFGGDYAFFTTFREGPAEMGVPAGEMDNVMHVSYEIGGNVLMGSDVPSTFSPPVAMGGNFSICYPTDSREETDALFGKISEGGNVTMPMGDMFWGSYFGACTDKFGINWMFDYTANPS